MTKNVEQRSSTWRKMKGALSSLTGGSSSNSVGYGGYSGYSGASGQGFSRDIDRLVDISESVKSLIREKDSDGVVSYSYHDERQTAQGLQGKLEALEKYSSQVSTYLKDKIDQPFYKAMDDVGARLEALSIASYKTGNTIGYKRTEVVKDTYGNPIGTRTVTPDEIGLEELYQVDNPYKDSLQASYQDYKNSDAYKDHKLTETEFLMASHHTRAFDYESIRDQQEAIEMWRDLALGAGVIILAVFCPPAAAVVGFTLAAADMYSAISGKDWGTGRQLSTEERVLRGSFALLELVPGIGYLNDVAKSGGKVAVKNVVKNSLREGFEQGAKNFDNMVKLTSKFGDNVLSKLDDFGRQADQVFNKLASKGADSLSTGLKNVDQGLSQAAQNFRLNMGLEPQLVSGAMPSPGSSSINKITNKLDDFSKARKLRVSNLDEVVGEGGNIKFHENPLSTAKRFNEADIIDYAQTMGKHYTADDIAKLTELTTHNADSKTALLGYFEPNSVQSYEQVAHANGWTYFDAGNDGWGAMAKIDPQLATKVNEEFLIKQIREGKDFILTSDPYKAREIADLTGKGFSYANEIDILANNGYKIKRYGNMWRAYK